MQQEKLSSRDRARQALHPLLGDASALRTNMEFDLQHRLQVDLHPRKADAAGKVEAVVV